ncbi:MAG TPA: beta-phosphoglucomutase family hydrolase [Streptosporangiaceae bacterium]|nr:beta-phosphoglucomutase family hydrolase [Streptosporangiaceae bacterium]
MLGLPDGIQACLFDLDGVLTKTAAVHAAAWKQMFDEYLRKRAAADGSPFTEFDIHDDYDEYVDGKPREDGVRDFLASRGITLPAGRRDDPASAETVFGLGNRKNELLLTRIREDGVAVFDGSVRYLEAVQQAGLRRAVVSSSANTAQVLQATGLDSYFEVRVDGVTIASRGLHGKPAPDTFLDAARQLGVEPAHASVFEDALSGVAAGRAGGFGFVVGVDRVGQARALAEHGADRVVQDLSELVNDA